MVCELGQLRPPVIRASPFGSPEAAPAMRISDILSPERIGCGVEARSKKKALEELSNLLSAAAPTLDARAIFDCFLLRERLGSTGLGFGVALPHGRLAHLEPAVGALVRLQEPVPEEATEEHLQLLSLLAEQLGSSTVRERLRSTDSPNTAYAILTGMATEHEQT